ncbi:MAG: DUF3010 family protein [Lutisporaceae bacterium]
MKIVCGIEISGNDANIVLLTGKKTDYSIVKSEFKKIRLEDDKNQSLIKSFFEEVENFMRQSQIDKLCIRRPASSGKFTAGPIAFKIEAILQLGFVPVELLHPNTIASIIKKSNIPDEMYQEVHKYQRAAFDAAYCGLED